MNKLQFFAAIAAAMGVSYEELSKGRKRLVEDVHKTYLTVREVENNDNLMMGIGINEERFNQLDAAIANAINNKLGKRLAESFEDFTKEADNPTELFAMGIMFQKGTSQFSEDDLPDFMAETLKKMKRNI